MNPFKSVRIPVSTHGLHKHDVNVPRMFTSSFFENIPVYNIPLHKGEKVKLNYHFFSRLTPLPVPSLVTGRYSIRSFFVPMDTIFKAYPNLVSGDERNFADGDTGFVTEARYIEMGVINHDFVNNANLAISVASTDPYDIVYLDGNTPQVVHYYKLTPLGCLVQKIFNACGISFSWDEKDQEIFNIYRILAYLRVMVDHYFPKQYVNSASAYRDIMSALEYDSRGVETSIAAADLLDFVAHVVYGWYDNGVFDSAFDHPVRPNGPIINSTNLVINDITEIPAQASQVTTATDGTPKINSPANASQTRTLSQYILDSLQNVNNWFKKHQLAGSRVLENWLIERGVEIPKTMYHISEKLQNYDIPFEITDVENNSDTNLGQLAGKGTVSSSGERNLEFKYTADSDGIYIIMQSCIPDCDTVCHFDPYNLYVNYMDFYHGQFDKQGPEAIPGRVFYQDQSGVHNQASMNQVAGFLNRYYSYAIDVPLVYGDFNVLLHGSQTLWAYNTFRNLYNYASRNNWFVGHSYEYLRVQNDVDQYFRMFYGKAGEDKIINSVRIKGSKYLNKLPLGDSYDWDDDEFNEKVTVMNAHNNV